MNSYLATLNFAVAYGQCDLTPGQTPPSTPEEIVAQAGENMTLVLVSEGSQQHRRYHATLRVETSTPDALNKQIIGLFNHLPDYETLDVRVLERGLKPAPEPASLAERQAAASEAGPTRPFRVQCLFRSALTLETLDAGFIRYAAKGNLVSNANRHCEYVAFVDVEAVSAEGLEDAVRTLLTKAFGADTEESAVNFQPITTKVL